MFKKILILSSLVLLSAVIVFPAVNCSKTPEEQITIRVGYFPNITHSQALVGISQGTFQKFLGDKVKIEVKVFNAGPSEIEALFAGEIDIGYIGPSPAINGYIKSNGEALRIIAGATSGGASLVVQPELAALYEKEGVGALEGKKIASPQQGNTQDVSLRHYLQENGLAGKTQIIPITNADQLTMFSLKQIDGAWAPEPWATRLVQEANGVRLIDEREQWPGGEFVTANIIVSTKFLKEHPDLVKKWLQAHSDITIWINSHPDEAQNIVNEEIGRLTTKKLPVNVLSEAWLMLDITVDPLKDSALTFAEWAFEQGFLGDKKPDLANLYDLTLLEGIGNNK